MLSLRSLVFVSTAGLFIAGSLSAGQPHTVPHKERAAGTLTDVLPPSDEHPLPSMVFSGGGYATHFGKYAISGMHDFDDQGHVLDGQFLTIASDGATIAGIYDGTYEVLDDGSISFEIYVLWLEGTGRLAGVTGEGDVIAILEAAAPGAAFEYVTDGFLTFP